MSACEYKVWSGRNKKIRMYTNMPEMICCGKPAVVINLPQNELVKKYLSNRKMIVLCEEHRVFVLDAIMPVEKIITETPKGFNLI
jgi:hypothetical protein